MADFVKFAKVRPLPDDNVASYDNALRFVEETKPLPPAENESNAAGEVTDSEEKKMKGVENKGKTDTGKEVKNDI